MSGQIGYHAAKHAAWMELWERKYRGTWTETERGLLYPAGKADSARRLPSVLPLPETQLPPLAPAVPSDAAPEAEPAPL